MVKTAKEGAEPQKHRSGSERAPGGAKTAAPPSSNTGGTGGNAARGVMNQSGTDEGRERLNLSISPQLRIALEVAARFMGLSASQVALHAIIEGMPRISEQARAMSTLANNAAQFQGKGGD
ncbi:hypothetical protein D9M69_447720 [compost metagenome]